MAFFSKKENVALDLQAISTIICEGSVFEGNLKAPACTRIDGQIIGDVLIDEGLIIGEKGTIKGNVIAKEMVVYGTINGNLQVTTLEIKATGKVNGDISTQTLTVENGAIYNGRLNMTKSNKPPTIKAEKPLQKVLEVG
jgi:cytoskeletal protein CcmA (bactofilin family)